MSKNSKPSLLDQIAAAEDVAEELVEVPEWGVSILFRGMSLAALIQLQGIDLEKANAGDVGEAIRMVQATACDPETKQLIFVGDHGKQVLAARNHEVLIRLLNEGALVVLGVDQEETAGKG